MFPCTYSPLWSILIFEYLINQFFWLYTKIHHHLVRSALFIFSRFIIFSPLSFCLCMRVPTRPSYRHFCLSLAHLQRKLQRIRPIFFLTQIGSLKWTLCIEELRNTIIHPPSDCSVPCHPSNFLLNFSITLQSIRFSFSGLIGIPRQLIKNSPFSHPNICSTMLFMMLCSPVKIGWVFCRLILKPPYLKCM